MNKSVFCPTIKFLRILPKQKASINIMPIAELCTIFSREFLRRLSCCSLLNWELSLSLLTGCLLGFRNWRLLQQLPRYMFQFIETFRSILGLPKTKQESRKGILTAVLTHLQPRLTNVSATQHMNPAYLRRSTYEPTWQKVWLTTAWLDDVIFKLW